MTFPIGASHDSVLFVTLDSCRYDTFRDAAAPAMRAVGPVLKAQAPSYFTFGSHAAMFLGFTPGVAERAEPLVNPKFAKIFKLVGAGYPGKGAEAYHLEGADIITGFANAGYATIGSSANGWFDPTALTGRHLSSNFSRFKFFPDLCAARGQIGWTFEQMAQTVGQNQFVFLHLNETHVPYVFEGCSWMHDSNPCVPFQTTDRREECRFKQSAALEHLDAALAPLLKAFHNSTVVICADHGDIWGEDGLWEHGVSHPMSLTVPLLIRNRGRPVA